MQLVAYGAQDVYLTGNPQITYWKVTYRRYTNFAMESIENPRNRQRLPMAPWLASCWMLKAMPPMAKASETQPTIIVIQFGEKNTRYA